MSAASRLPAGAPPIPGPMPGQRAQRYDSAHGWILLIDRDTGGDWIDGDGRWQLLCHAHGNLLDCDTRRQANDFISAPGEWCEALDD